MRALTTREDRKFTLYLLGLNQIRDCSRKVNKRLPIHLRPEGNKITGHGGRATHYPEAVASGCDNLVIAKITKHKSPSVLMGYVKENLEMGMRSAISLGKRAMESSSNLDNEEENIQNKETEEYKCKGNNYSEESQISLPYSQPMLKKKIVEV